MPLIQFPSVPSYPGVPLLIRPAQVAIAQNPVLAIGIGTVENILIGALQQAPLWGIFDSDGNQLGLSGGGGSIIDALVGQVTGQTSAVLSTFSFDYTKETRVSSFPLERGGFANYNKVEIPGSPVVTLILDGNEDDRTRFLEAVDAACISTDLFSVVTPEITYANYTITRYNYSRRAQKGATLLMVDIVLEEIRTVSASFTALSTASITNPQNAAATPQTNNGITQPSTPDTSTLRSLATKLGIN
jgi:hypothetical protein